MIARSTFAFAALVLIQSAQAATTYTFAINQELSEVVEISEVPKTFQIRGSFDLVVDTSTNYYRAPSARISPRSIEISPLDDRRFNFPSYFIRYYTEVGPDSATFSGSGDFCDEFNARRNRGGTCWSHGSSSSVSGTLDGNTLHIEGTSIGVEFLDGGGISFFDGHDYNIYATLVTPEPADFDADGDIDGRDFLALQRTDITLIEEWGNAFGVASGTVAAVPEPSNLLLTVFAGNILMLRRRDHRLGPWQRICARRGSLS